MASREDGWRGYARRLLLLGGTLFLLAGIIFFIAANWAGMHRCTRLLLTGLLVAGTGFGAASRGTDAVGQMLLLVCGVAIGPMLAVFGQAYQTGAELWELFGVWALVLLALAAGGKQSGLWFAAWFVGNVFAMLLLGRDMDNPLDAVSFSSSLPEFVLALALACTVWEAAAWKLRDAARHAWLQSRWLPRLLFFDLMVRLTVSLCHIIFSHAAWTDQLVWHIPRQPVLQVLYLFAVYFSWPLRRTTVPDLFMPACTLASAATLFVCLLVRAEFLLDLGISSLFCWGSIIVGLTAGIGKILLVLQRKVEECGKGTAPAPPAARERTPSPAKPPVSPWYVRAMLAFGGWIAAVLFFACAALFLFDNLAIRASNAGEALLLLSPAPLGIAFALLRGGGAFTRHFGFAMALAGTTCAASGIIIALDGGGLSFFLSAALLAALCAPMNSAAYRCTAAAAIACLVPVGIGIASADAFDAAGNNALPSFFPHGATINGADLWWAALGIGIAVFLLTGHGRRIGKTLKPMVYGAFAGMMLCQICSLSIPLSDWADQSMTFFPMAVFRPGIGSAAGVIFFVWRLAEKHAARTERALAVGCAFLSLPLGYALPGASLAVFGLAAGKQTGSLAMRGATGAFLFVYMVYYYYFLDISLRSKSLLLAGTGAALLALAALARLTHPVRDGLRDGGDAAVCRREDGHA